MKSVFEYQLEDKDILNELGEAATQMLQETQSSAGLESAPVGNQSVEEAVKRVKTGAANLAAPSLTEAVVMTTGYPSLLIRNGRFETPRIKKWKNLLERGGQRVLDAIASVGRVDLIGHRDYKMVGTAWRISEDAFVTNRHVAQVFADLRNGKWDIAAGLQATVDLREEHGNSDALEVLVSAITHIEEGRDRDIAIMRFDPRGMAGIGDPIPLGTNDAPPEALAIIGYPARAIRDNPVDAVNRYFDGIFNVKRLAPGHMMDTDYSADAFTHSATTLGGNSGSVVIDIESGEAIGLHYAGSALTQNYAVKIETVKDVLASNSIAVTRPGGNDPDEAGADPGGAVSERVSAADLQGREGYRPDFLGTGAFYVPLPKPNWLQAGYQARTHENAPQLDYTHFSVVMNASRKLAFCAAANIDGDELRRPRRINTFRLDPRLDRAHQVGNELYKNNPLDRGHLIRRLDPAWGSKAEAQQASWDSMFYTNIGPQHKDLNQRIWLQLEEHILNRTEAKDARISVFVGCLFGDDDPVHAPTGVKVPMGFWKIVASIGHSGRGRSRRRRLDAQAFVLYQGHLVKPDDLELIFGDEFEEHQVTVEELERISGLDFGPLREADTFGLTPDMRREIIERETETPGSSSSRREHVKPLRDIGDVELG